MAYSDLLMTSPWNPDGEVVAFSAVENLATPLQRGQAIIRQGVKVKTWWVAHRGLFRISTARETGALRRHPFGEAAADWGWVLALALRGELIRVPATLYTKNFHSGGLSAKWLGRSWRSRSSQWAGGLWMCATTIIRAPLRIPDKLRLGFTTAGLGARWFGWLGKRALRISAE
jgi:hypothetical protein